MTPDSSSWDPYCPSFAFNEESMMIHKGNLQPPERCNRTFDPGVASVSSIQFNKQIDLMILDLHKLEVGTLWASRAELYIGIMKEAVRKDLRKSDSPLALWDYCMERRAAIHNSIPCDLFQANGLSLHEVTFGEQGDISNICTFDWYEWVYYKEPNSYPSNCEVLGRVLGPINNEGNQMAQAVLTSRGTIVPRHCLKNKTCL